MTSRLPWRVVDDAVGHFFFTPDMLFVFRRHPEQPAYVLFDEGWPLGSIWQIHGRTCMDGTDGFFQRRLSYAAMLGEDHRIGLFYLCCMVFIRRRWLKQHAQCVPRRLWRRATRLY